MSARCSTSAGAAKAEKRQRGKQRQHTASATGQQLFQDSSFRRATVAELACRRADRDLRSVDLAGPDPVEDGIRRPPSEVSGRRRLVRLLVVLIQQHVMLGQYRARVAGA
eukprot:779019-Rhodomonas_salina.1